MSTNVNELGDYRQVLEALTSDRAQTQLDLLRCRCPQVQSLWHCLWHGRILRHYLQVQLSSCPLGHQS
ncbi:hypothetical protein [Synechocystis sp. PCC 7509]|uniref:hypothetical protein n=1 Tax=Synechocystis sp. PCC 7509 TaxID=927677 RepID=UPI0011DD0261|nr:hypothetical protein [Synechocystis sp. PCC 7509]